MLTFMVACSDDDKNDTPINGLEIPKFENPVTPGQTITIKGEGFDEDSEIWFRQIATRTTDNDDVKAEVTGVDANGITFVAPSVYGNQTVLLKQDGREYKLGEMLFADQPEAPADAEILPKKIKKVTEYEDEYEYEYIYEYEYYADGRIKFCKLLSYNETNTYIYSDNKITVKNDGTLEDEFTFILENGRIVSFSDKYKDSDGDYKADYKLEYDKEGYLSNVEMRELAGESMTETFSCVGGNLVNYTFKDNVEKDNYSSVEFIYGEQLNNLNIDMFYFIGSYYFDSNIDLAFQFNLIGKRSYYLPSSMKVTRPEWDDDEDKVIGYKTYTAKIEYEMDGEYITKITIREEGHEDVDEDEWSEVFKFEYED